MIDYKLDLATSILTLRPESALEKNDFIEVAQALDPQIEQHGDLVARGGFAGGSDGIFEIEDDGIGAQRERLFDATRMVAWGEKEGAVEGHTELVLNRAQKLTTEETEGKDEAKG